MTTRHDEEHITHFLVLFSGLVLFLVLFILFRYNDDLQLLVGASGSLFYVFWGIVHHALEKRLTSFVVFEYILFGILAFVMLFTAMNV